MNTILREIFDTKSVRDVGGASVPLHANLPELEGAILSTWVRDVRPKRIIEVGFAFGISTMFICDAIEDWTDVEYDIIDPKQSTDWQDIGRANMSRAGYGDRYRLHEAKSEIALPRMLAEGKRCDFAFIDGMHRFDNAANDFFYVHRMLDIGGVIVFDDVDMPSLTRLTAMIRTFPCYEDVPLPPEMLARRELRLRRMAKVPPSRILGFRKTAKDERKSNWHVEF
jgi:predicted O-methyltransferase YrrM